MINPRTTKRQRLPHTKIATLLAIAGLSITSLSGCGGADEAEQAVKEAGRNFTSIANGDPNATSQFSKTTYQKNEELVSPFVGSENGFSESAAINLSLAKLGQASLAAQDAVDAESSSLHKARIIRGLINEWLTMTAIATGASQFDASEQIAELNNYIDLREDDIEQYEDQRRQIESQIADLDSQIEDLLTKSSFERNESGKLELQMARVSAAEAAEIVIKVREHTLRADRYQLEASRIQGIVDQLRPNANEINLNVDKAKAQVDLLNKAQEELREREASSRSDAQQARQAANQAEQNIRDAVEEYTQFRSDDVESANDRVTSLTRASISALSDAKDALKSLASLTKASAQQTLAESYARQAAGHAESVILYNALIEANIEGHWESLAREAQAAHDQAHADSQDTYQSAASSLRSARIRGAKGEKVEATAVRLEHLGGVEPDVEEEYYEEETNYEDEGADFETSEESDGSEDDLNDDESEG